MNTRIFAIGSVLLLACASPETLPALTPPGAITVPAVIDSFDQALLQGIASPGAQAASAHFEYGLTTAYGNATPPVTQSAGYYPPTTSAAYFYSSSQYAVATNFGTYAPTNEVTIEFWQNASSAKTQSSFLLMPDGPTDRINSHVPWIDGQLYWDFGNINTGGRLSYLTNGLVGTWNHIALVASLSGNYMRIYRNGILEAQKSGMSPFSPSATDLWLGGGPTTGFFTGAMAEFRVWRQALDQATLQNWMNRTLTSAHPAWSNIVAYWPMNEGVGNNFADQSGNGHTAGLTNSPNSISTSMFTATVAGLSPATTYHFRLVVTNSTGVTYGNDLAFTTPKAGYPFIKLRDVNGVSDGANPYSGMTLVGNTLFGTSSSGSSNSGTVFKLQTDGTGFAPLHVFSVLSTNNTNPDGFSPNGTLVVSGNTVYGVADTGGTAGNGTIFKVNTDGSGFSVLHSFAPSPSGTNADGFYPSGGLILAADTLYGVATSGGSLGYGTIFKLSTNGSGFQTLYQFANQSDGASPYGTLVANSNVLYGTASAGGLGNGTIFKINTDGTGFAPLHIFPGTDYTNSDGYWPYAGLILASNTLYGAAVYGGTGGNGTIFRLNTDGTGFSTLHNFSMANGTNNDGAFPYARLALVGETLYGATYQGGYANRGTVFKLNTDGTAFTVMHTFSGPGATNTDGMAPVGALAAAGNIVFGSTAAGGAFASGTLFAIESGPTLTSTRVGNSLVLSWSTNALGYALQSTADLRTPATWTAVTPAPAIVGGQYAVTNPISGSKRFFRLVQ